MLKAASEISYDKLSTTSSDKLNKRPRSHLMESSSVNRHETSFESYFHGVERSASNSDVVRIRVPYTREDALNIREGLNDRLHKANSQDADSNKIRISVNHDQNGSGGGGVDSSSDAGNGNRGSLEESFNTKLVMKKKKNNHYIKSNSKSMTNL